MQYKTYKKISDSWETYILGDHPIYYIQLHESYILPGPVCKISPDPDFKEYYIITKYILHKHFTPALDICSNIFMKV